MNGAFELLELPLILRRKTLALGSLADVGSAFNACNGPLINIAENLAARLQDISDEPLHEEICHRAVLNSSIDS